MLPIRKGALISALVLLSACSSQIPNRDPTGQVFPTVQSQALDGKARALPTSLTAPTTVLLVGYVQNAQFDCDRWILGLLQAETPTALYEVPTIDGMIPGMIAGRIDQGMRNGIPEEDWGSVLTVYDDADAITAFTGTEKPNNARVFVLDEHGNVLWFHDRGYSAVKLLELDAVCRQATN